MKTKPVILLVDDDLSIYKTMNMLFPGKSYSILHCKDINCAFEVLQSQRVDLMILDLFMPNGSGISLLERLKEYGINVNTVMLSASDTAKSATEAMKLGAIDYFTKPFNTKDFVARISQYAAQGSL